MRVWKYKNKQKKNKLNAQPIKLFRYCVISSKSQFRSLKQQEAAQLCYEHIFMLELKNDFSRITQRLVLKS